MDVKCPGCFNMCVAACSALFCRCPPGSSCDASVGPLSRVRALCGTLTRQTAKGARRHPSCCRTGCARRLRAVAETPHAAPPVVATLEGEGAADSGRGQPRDATHAAVLWSCSGGWFCQGGGGTVSLSHPSLSRPHALCRPSLVVVPPLFAPCRFPRPHQSLPLPCLPPSQYHRLQPRAERGDLQRLLDCAVPAHGRQGPADGGVLLPEEGGVGAALPSHRQFSACSLL